MPTESFQCDLFSAPPTDSLSQPVGVEIIPPVFDRVFVEPPERPVVIESSKEIDHLAGLNPQQMAVAVSDNACSVVLAGAGTGKTKTAVAWVLEKVKNGVAPRRVAMLTFTKKAAHEMSERIVAAYGAKSGLFAGTFHSFALRHMRGSAAAFGFHVDKIAPLHPRDAMDLLAQELNLLGIKTVRRITKKNAADPSAFSDDDEGADSVPGAIMSEVRRSKDGGYSLPDIVAIIGGSLSNLLPVSEELNKACEDQRIGEAYANYVSFLQRHGLVDYDHLLHFLMETLRDNESFRAYLGRQYSYIMVDEVQDNNALQFEIMALLPVEHKMLIGDIQQSIYQFRGAYPQGVLDFVSKNPDCVEYRLEINYRSQSSILEAANYVVAQADKALTLIPYRDGDGSVLQCQCWGDSNAAEEVASLVASQVAAEGEENVSVLSWTLGSPTVFLLEQQLKKRGIATRRVGGKGVLNSPEVLDFCSLLRVAYNGKDIVALRRALMLKAGVGAKKADSLMQQIARWGDDPKNWGEEVSYIRTPIELLRAGAEIDFSIAIKETLNRLESIYKDNDDDDCAAKMVKPNTVASYCFENKLDLEQCIEEFVLQKEEPEDKSIPKVTISTIHSAKGLEWQHVTMICCGENEFGHPDTDEAERRRLMYVGVTRARDTLTLVHQRQSLHEFLPPIIDYV